MKKVIYFFVCFFITTTWGCTNEKIMESNQKLVKAFDYDGNNFIGDAFIKDLRLSDEKKANLELLLGETRSLVLDYAEQGSNIKDGMFYAIPIRNLNNNLIEEYLLATLNMRNGVTGLDKLMIVNENVLMNSVVNKQYESYFYIWNQSDLNILPSVYSITEEEHAKSFFKNNLLRWSGHYNVYEFKAEYSWDYSMLASGVKKEFRMEQQDEILDIWLPLCKWSVVSNLYISVRLMQVLFIYYFMHQLIQWMRFELLWEH